MSRTDKVMIAYINRHREWIDNAFAVEHDIHVNDARLYVDYVIDMLESNNYADQQASSTLTDVIEIIKKHSEWFGEQHWGTEK